MEQKIKLDLELLGQITSEKGFLYWAEIWHKCKEDIGMFIFLFEYKRALTALNKGKKLSTASLFYPLDIIYHSDILNT
jgi:hypothetical protein